MATAFRGKLKEEDGQGLVEYSLIILFVAVAVVVGLSGLGLTLSGTYDWIVSNLPF